MAADSLQLEVFHHLFASAAEEMGASLMRSSFSPNIQERRDFSCAIFDGEGRMLSQAAHIPIHLGSIPLCVRAALERFELERGDVVVLNDPYRGGTHLPDVTLVTPVFLSHAKRPEFLCANRAHHADIGGAWPGSMAPAYDVHGEGLIIPPTRLVRNGEVQREVFDLLLANMRVPREREGDLFAQLSANRIGSERLVSLAREQGLARLRRAGAQLLDWTERLTRAEIEKLPRRAVACEDVLETAQGNVKITVTIARRARDLVFDWSGCDEQSAAPINTTRAVALSAVFYVLRLLLPPGTPTNEGLLRPARVVTRPGSVVDARYPAPVAAGNVETSQRLVDVLLGAMAQLDPVRVPASSSGTMSNLSFGGPRSGKVGGSYTYYETIAGGAGGGPEGSGAHAVHTHMTNTRNTPIEALETQFPVRVEALSVRRESGGAGLSRGGDGIQKRVRFLSPARVGWIADRSVRGPGGLAGGKSGAVGGASVQRADGSREALPSQATLSLEAGDAISILTPGGGGFGESTPLS
ncbi:MAG TPA: hydantoinase B/oxoprolinase family protein [Planctomycetota bacterium]|nr:hydantoinase B/oxoprolinase family protein [Planctomycetota bacterium]